MMNESGLNIWDLFGGNDNNDSDNSNDAGNTDSEGETREERIRRLMREIAAKRAALSDDDDEDDDDIDNHDNDDDDIDPVVTNGDGDDIHNKSCDYARRGMFARAAQVCILGLKRFPRNVDLIADCINYLGKQGDFNAAHEYLAIQNERVPKSAWNWRSFTFAIDTLVAEDPYKNYEEARQLAEDYMRCLPLEERAYTALYDVESAVGNHAAAIAALERAVKEHPAAEQCSLRLADKMQESGNFSRAREIAIRAIAASAQSQPGIRSPYAMLVLCLAEDAMMWKKIADGAEPDPVLIKRTLARYEALNDELSHRLSNYSREVSDRTSMLKVLLAGCESAVETVDMENDG